MTWDRESGGSVGIDEATARATGGGRCCLKAKGRNEERPRGWHGT